MAASWALYMFTLRKRMPEPAEVAPLYLFALGWQFVHFIEEFETGFQFRWLTEIFRTQPYGDNKFVLINLLSYTAFAVSGVGLMLRVPHLSIPAIFFTVMGVMVNGVQHPLYSAMTRGYFPGLWSSLGDLVLGPLLLKRMLTAPVDLDQQSPSAA